MVLGFLIGFISFYYNLPYVLIFFLCVHIMGILYSERGVSRLKGALLVLIICFRTIVYGCLNAMYKLVFRPSPSKAPVAKALPKEYMYNFHLKPTNDLRLQQVRTSLSLSK